ncbi:MAG: transposase [Steroidobacteraceae bacterium]
MSDQQWERIQEHFADQNLPNDRPGRKPIALLRMLEGALWILNTGAQWHMLPHCYPNHKTAHGGFQQWCRNDALRNVLTDPAEALRDTGAVDERERSIDTTFASAKGDGDEIGKTKR